MAHLAIVDGPVDCSGAGRGEEHAPAALRAAGLLERLRGRDAGEADARIRDTPSLRWRCAKRGAARVGSEAAARLGKRPAWLHLDLDVLDEAVLRVVSYPQSLGLIGMN